MKGSSVRTLAGLLAIPGAVGIAGVLAIGQATAQLVCLPLPRLLTLVPAGATAGSCIEVTLAGESLDAPSGEATSRLRFSHPGISAEPKRSTEGAIVPNVYVVSVAADVPTGLHEAHVVTPLGASSSRVFAVGRMPEVLKLSPNLSPEAAMPLPRGTVANGHVSRQAVDHFSFEGIGARRVVVECAARGIESKLRPVLAVADATGRDLAVERLAGRLAFTPPADGTYLVKVHDLSFQGGPEHFYRLVVHDAPESGEPSWHPSTRPVHAFSWPPSGLDGEPADEAGVESGRMISLPCDIAGRFHPAADVDAFEFEAHEGESWWIEVASHRIGCPTDPSVVVQRVMVDGTEERLEDVLELSDIPSPIKPSSNAYAYDGPPYDAGSADVLGRLDIKTTGRYRLSLRDLFGGTRDDPSCRWRLVIRRPQPDFSLVAWALHAELRNGDRNALSKPLALRGGGTIALEVAAFRRDGFDGPIDVSLDGLPAGVTAEGIRVPAGAGRGYLLVTAGEEASPAVVAASLSGSAEIGGERVTRPGCFASMSWPVRDHWQEMPMPRLLPELLVSVGSAERFPVVIEAAARGESPDGSVASPLQAPERSTFTIPLAIRRQGELSGGSMRLKAIGAGFDQLPPFEIPLTADAHEVAVDLSKVSLPAGDHTLAFHGSVVALHTPSPATTDAREKRQPQEIAEVLVSRPVHVRILPNPKESIP